jgi:hypothetical protein
MVNTNEVFDVKTEEGFISISNEGEKLGQLTLRSNNAYEKVLGFNFIIKKTTKIVVNGETKYVPSEEPYLGPARVSIVEAAGRVIMSLTPFELLKHAKEQKYVDRFVEFDNIKGYDNDIRIGFSFPPDPTSVVPNVVNYQIIATALYSKRAKSTF